MSAHKHGGPAFPATTINDGDINATDEFGSLLPPGGVEAYPGMTLRDYFAAKVMQAALSHQATGEIEAWLESCARYSYIAADAMLKARQA